MLWFIEKLGNYDFLGSRDLFLEIAGDARFPALQGDLCAVYCACARSKWMTCSEKKKKSKQSRFVDSSFLSALLIQSKWLGFPCQTLNATIEHFHPIWYHYMGLPCWVRKSSLMNWVWKKSCDNRSVWENYGPVTKGGFLIIYSQITILWSLVLSKGATLSIDVDYVIVKWLMVFWLCDKRSSDFALHSRASK